MFSRRFFTLAIVLLAGTQFVVSAQPHGLRRHRHRRDVTIVTRTTATVYVDQYGATIDPKSKNDPIIVTVTARKKPANTQKSAPAPAAPTYASEPAPVAPSPTPEVPSYAPVQGTPSSSTKEAAPGRPSAPGSKPGIVYSPYSADGSCKSKEQVAADVEKIKDFSPIRLYGVDCQQIQNVIAATKQYGTQVMAGVYDMEKVSLELQTLIEAVGNDWNSVHTVAIGNEVVNFGRMSANDYAGVINSSRATLRSAGYNQSVVGIDTFVAIMSNPAICEASDYVAANCHPFFDKSVLPAQSGEFLDNMKKEMAKVCGDKKIMITETGWPTQGGVNGAAVPSVDNQKAALASILRTQGNDVILFTAFDDLWKKDTPLTFNAEKHWGIKDLTLSDYR